MLEWPVVVSYLSCGKTEGGTECQNRMVSGYSSILTRYPRIQVRCNIIVLMKYSNIAIVLFIIYICMEGHKNCTNLIPSRGLWGLYLECDTPPIYQGTWFIILLVCGRISYIC